MKLKIRKFAPAPPLVGVEPNPGPSHGQHLNEEERWRVVHLSTEVGLSERAIAKRMRVQKTTVHKILTKYRKTGDIKDRPGRGRKRKISTEDEVKIAKKVKKGKSSSELAREYKFGLKSVRVSPPPPLNFG